MNRKGTKFLIGSFASIIVMCIIVFAMLSVYMSVKTEESITETSNIYMEEINNQINQKFNSILSLRMLQLNGVYKRTPPGSEDNTEKLLEQLKVNAEVRDFSTLGFLSESGEIETVYGESITMTGKEQAIEFLGNTGRFLTRGENLSGELVMVLGIAASYPMENGETSISLFAAIPMEYLNDALYLRSDDEGMYFHIIDGDGTFIIKNTDVSDTNYFSRMLSGLDQYEGKQAAQYVDELKESMAAHENYSVIVSYFGEKKHIFCSPIYDQFDWYLVAIMPEEILSKSIVKLDGMRIGVTIVSILFIVIYMFVIFAIYYKMMRQQMRDLAESRKEAERASKAKSEFLSSMSHDIRTPLNAIIGMTEIATWNVRNPERVQEHLKKISLSGKHLLGLINDVLDMSKIESGKMELNESVMSLKDTMEDIVNIIQPQVKEKKQNFDIFIRDIVAEDIRCDSLRLNQVLINILSNAMKFTPEEGRIDVFVYQEPSPKGDDYVRTHFRVEDTGIGMSEEFQKRIFETFAREESEYAHQVTGTGLGMAITKSIVDMMGGTIELQSQVKKGSKFHIILDFKKADIKEKDMKLPPWKILVVDDNEELCMSAAANLEELGTHADWLTDGAEAIEQIEEHHKKDEDYNFVLIDWKMPHMDGLEIIREIRERVKKEIPIFLVSAYDWSDVEEEVNSSAIEGFIPKPLFKSTLFERLRRYMDGYQEQEQEQYDKKGEVKADFSGKRILLAEDMELNWEVAYEMLSPSGMQIERAKNGKECVEMLQSSEIGYYDAILMDIRMPVMNGYDATKAIRALDRADSDLPIIAMTADAFADDIQYCLNCGMNGHLAKPIDLQACLRLLQKFLS